VKESWKELWDESEIELKFYSKKFKWESNLDLMMDHIYLILYVLLHYHSKKKLYNIEFDKNVEEVFYYI